MKSQTLEVSAAELVRGENRRPDSETCRDARRGLRWYRAAERKWRSKMGAETRTRPRSAGYLCPRLRLLAKHARQAAHRARLAYKRWSYSWEWQRWLPAKFYRVARCETGVRWDWDSGTYVSAFGIIRVAYEQFHHWTGHNTPREQYEVAERIRARYGWSAWGCGGA